MAVKDLGFKAEENDY